jgi:hypothetical protein
MLTYWVHLILLYSLLGQERAARLKQRMMRANVGLEEEIGMELYSHRYLRRPRDNVVLFCAMISGHCDLNPREQEMGRKWCGVWDDASARFKRLMTIGFGLSGLT